MASRIASMFSSVMYLAKPSTPPKPPVLYAPAGFLGMEVLPASELIALKSGCFSSFSASVKASEEPPRMRIFFVIEAFIIHFGWFSMMT